MPTIKNAKFHEIQEPNKIQEPRTKENANPKHETRKSESVSNTRSETTPLLLVLCGSALMWGALFTVILPSDQDFPLVDDWAYARGVFAFAQGQGIHYPKWASMPQLGQWLWACPFLWVFGINHVALRLATIVLSWLGLAAFYDLLRQEGISPGRSALASACLALNPLCFLLQGTFMTDIPSLSFSLVGLACYNRAFVSGHKGWLAAGCAVALLGVMTRQNVLTVPLAAGFLLLRYPLLRRRVAWWLAIMLPIAAGLVTHQWFSGRSDTMPAEPEVPGPAVVVLMPYLVVHLCGLAALPLLVLDPRPGSWKRIAIALLLMLANAYYWLKKGKDYLVYEEGLFPYSDSILTPWGAYSGKLIVGQRPLLLGQDIRVFLTLVGCIAGALLLVRAMEWWQARKGPNALLVFSALQMPFIFVAPDLWDRYVLVLFPGALYLAASGRAAPRWTVAPALAVLVVMAGISLSLMHDWLAWNSARWALGRQAVDSGIAPQDIEGGFEWDGWYAPNERPQIKSMKELFRYALQPRAAKALTLLPTRNWFPHVTGRYALAFSPTEHSVVLESIPYRQWLLPGPREFYLLRYLEPKHLQGIQEESGKQTNGMEDTHPF
jgi:hypothetical protein